jgi:ABC-type glutathione transport system ATPase component
MSVLETSGLTITLAGEPLVRDVAFELAEGDRVGLIGESGSGKSLTALAMLGLLPEGMHVSGRILINGRDYAGAPDRQWRGVRGSTVSVVFQEPLTALDPLMAVGRQIAGPLRLHQGLNRSDAERHAIEWCRRVHLPEPERLVRALPHEISGGQRQRVALAMALACRPRVLIADEPTTALDVTVQAQILGLLDELVDQTGVALLFISHDLPVVAGLARHLLVMRDGRLVESGPVDDVLRRPTSAYARQLVASAVRVTRLARPGPATPGSEGEPR